MGITVVVQASQLNIGWSGRLFKKFDVGKNVIGLLIERLLASNFRVIVATSTMQEDDVFEEISAEYRVECVRGEQRDIVKRLLKVTDRFGCQNFIRVSAYSPLVDIQKLNEMYDAHVKGRYDYSFNEHYAGVPMGMGGDVFSVNALQSTDSMNLAISQKEFVGLYIRQNETIFKVNRVTSPNSTCYRGRFSVETPKDFEVVNEILNHITDINVDAVSRYIDQHKVLKHYNCENPPREAGVEKLMLNVEKVEAIMSESDVDFSYPISVELTLTNACNLKCVYCSDLALRGKQGVNPIRLEEFQRLFDDLVAGGTKGVVLEGGGEPTIYSHFSEVVKYARSVGLAVGLITNGTQTLDAQILQEFEWIRVSLDASTKEEYFDLKGVDAFEMVLSNIASYVRYCHTVGVGYVVTNKNISQLESLVLRLRMIGVSYIQLRPVVDNPKLYPTDIELDYLKYYEKSDFGVEIGGMVDNADRGNNHLPCYAHSVTSIISGDGSVYLCGRLNIYDWLKPIGNIREQSFHEIWYGEERKKQSEMVASATFCEKNCPQCRISKFNSVFDRLYSVQTKHFI